MLKPNDSLVQNLAIIRSECRKIKKKPNKNVLRK